MIHLWRSLRQILSDPNVLSFYSCHMWKCKVAVLTSGLWEETTKQDILGEALLSIHLTGFSRVTLHWCWQPPPQLFIPSSSSRLWLWALLWDMSDSSCALTPCNWAEAVTFRYGSCSAMTALFYFSLPALFGHCIRSSQLQSNDSISTLAEILYI